MRVGIVGLLHESNTFIRSRTTWDDFAADLLLGGEAIRDQLAGTHHEIGGFFAGLEQAGISAVPLFAARAVPHGPIDGETFERLSEIVLDSIASAGPLDGLLAAVHGAAVCERWPDADGQLLSRLRQAIGNQPLIATLDPHANLSSRMVAACDALVAYRTNPHLDQRDRGVEAAGLIARTLRGEVRPVTAACRLPLAINIERQCTSESHWAPMLARAAEWRERPGVLSLSILLGFPYSDVAEMGAAVLAVAEGDAQLAQEAAADVGALLWQHRQDLVGRFLAVEEAIERGLALPGPVCLLDMGDNVGGGSPGDGTWIAHALQARGISSFVCLYDPTVARAAAAAGEGQLLELAVGGKSDDRHGPPLVDRFRVVGVFEGKFEEPQPRHGGARHFDQGQTVVLENARGLEVMVNSRRTPPFSLRQLTSFRVEPQDFALLVAKGVHAPLAAYREVCPHFLRVDTPGVTSANLERLEFHHRRRPLFPFEPETEWKPPE